MNPFTARVGRLTDYSPDYRRVEAAVFGRQPWENIKRKKITEALEQLLQELQAGSLNVTTVVNCAAVRWRARAGRPADGRVF